MTNQNVPVVNSEQVCTPTTGTAHHTDFVPTQPGSSVTNLIDLFKPQVSFRPRSSSGFSASIPVCPNLVSSDAIEGKNERDLPSIPVGFGRVRPWLILDSSPYATCKNFKLSSPTTFDTGNQVIFALSACRFSSLRGEGIIMLCPRANLGA